MAINLLPRDLQKQREKKASRILASVVSASILVVAIVGMVVLFSYRVTLARQLERLTVELGDVTGQIEGQRVVEGTLQSLRLKLDQAQDSVTNQIDYADILQDIQTFSGNDVNVQEVILKEENKFQINGKTDQLEKLADYMGRLESSAKSNVAALAVSRLTFDPSDFRYEFVLDFTLDKMKVE